MAKSIKKILKQLLIACMLTIHITCGATTYALDKDLGIAPFQIRPETITYEEDLPNVEDIIKIDKPQLTSEKTTILIYHSHSQEAYKDWDIIKAGEELADELRNEGYVVEHVKEDFSSQRGYNLSYVSSRKYISKIIKDYGIAIDLHRNVGDDDRIMFVAVEDQSNYKQQRAAIDAIKGNINDKYIKNDTIYDNVIKNKSFNQDLGNVYLVELGGVDNTKTEIQPLIKALGNGIDTYIKNKDN